MRRILKALAMLTFGVPLLAISATASSAECKFKFCAGRADTSGPSTRVITNTARQRLGDLYHPGGDRRVQIRDNNLKILGYVEKDGTITNTNRQRIGTIGDLID